MCEGTSQNMKPFLIKVNYDVMRCVVDTHGDGTCSNLQRVDLHDEILLQAEEPDDGKEVDEDESEQCRQQDGATVPSHTLYHVK